MTETQTVTDRAAADFLTSPETRFLLGPFMQRETTSSEAAAALGGMGLNTLHRRVQQMLTLEFIEVTCELGAARTPGQALPGDESRICGTPDDPRRSRDLLKRRV